MVVDQDRNQLRWLPFPVDPPGVTVHSCDDAARDDAGFVLHTHSRAGVAVGVQKAGGLPLAAAEPAVHAGACPRWCSVRWRSTTVRGLPCRPKKSRACPDWHRHDADRLGEARLLVAARLPSEAFQEFIQ